MELLKKVGLEDLAHQLPSSVSSGQQQSAAIARALATDPPIIMADEPTGNLDSRSAENILRLFSDMADQGKTILIVTHDPSFTKRTHQTVILSDGEIIDEAIARSLPLLNHPQMLKATHQAEQKIYQPGATIVEQGLPIEHFFMIADGEVDVVLNNPGCPEMALARLGKGQFFGEVELLHNEDSIASERASLSEPVKLSLLPKAVFENLLEISPDTQDVIEQVAQKRLSENLAQNGDCE
jgi:putative ABC transport system ATP-binding protein